MVSTIARRRPVAADPRAQVRITRLFEDRSIPMLVTPAVAGLELVDWAERLGIDGLDALLVEHRALLFRGFEGQTAETLHPFFAATCRGGPLKYRDRTTPRYEIQGGVYTSTTYPHDRRIALHNEGSYWTTAPFKLYFACRTAAQAGGETPIADVVKVHGRLRPELVEPFERHGFMLIRNYHDGISMPWREVFQTDDRAEVERYCRANAIEAEWLPDNRLRTRQVRKAVRVHPRTGDKAWFNHAAFFHISSYAPDVAAAMLSSLGPDDLPYATRYGDGSPIPDSVIAEINQAYEAEKVQFPWREGDVMLLDNVAVAHAREPYIGDRMVYVAMGEILPEC